MLRSVLTVSLTSILCLSCMRTSTKVRKGYSASAARVYLRAMRALKDKHYLEAIKLLKLVRRHFAFSRFAVLSELRMADVSFAREQYAEAISAYRAFMRIRRTHKLVPYAQYRISLGYFKMIPEDWWILPPVHERDQSATRKALSEVRRFLRYYPRNEYVVEVRLLYRKLLRKLANHEMYVAKFYLDRSRYRAAAWRLEGLKSKYLGLRMDEKIYYLLGYCYDKLKERKKARKILTELVQQYSTNVHTLRARALLKRLR